MHIQHREQKCYIMANLHKTINLGLLVRITAHTSYKDPDYSPIKIIIYDVKCAGLATRQIAQQNFYEGGIGLKGYTSLSLLFLYKGLKGPTERGFLLMVSPTMVSSNQ